MENSAWSASADFETLTRAASWNSRLRRIDTADCRDPNAFQAKGAPRGAQGSSLCLNLRPNLLDRSLAARRASRSSVHCSWKSSFRTSNEPAETNEFPCWMSTQQAALKPSLTGVRIKARKGAVKAQAKHEPESKP
jgi:hypothetical protein